MVSFHLEDGFTLLFYVIIDIPPPLLCWGATASTDTEEPQQRRAAADISDAGTLFARVSHGKIFADAQRPEGG